MCFIPVLKKYQKVFIFPFIIIAFLFDLSAQSVKAEESYTIEALVQKGLARSNIINAAKEHVQSSVWTKKHAGRMLNPSLGLGYGRKKEESVSGNAYEVSLTQSFFSPGKQRLRYEVKEMDQKQASLSLEKKTREIRYQIIRLSYTYMAHQNLIEHIQERVDRFRLIKKYMQGRPFVSPQARAEKAIVENKLLLFERDLSLLKSEYENVWAQLNFYLDFSEKIKINLEWFKEPPKFVFDQLLQSAFENNLHLKKLKIRYEKVAKEKELAQKEAFPDFSLSTSFEQENAVAEEQRFNFGISFDLPLFNRNQYLIKSLSSESRQRKAELEVEKDLVKQKLISLWAEYQQSVLQLQLFPLSLLQEIDDELKAIDQEFQKNRVGLLTYLEVESQVYETHVAIYESQISFIKTYTKLLILLGQNNF